jgi:undecaprenyl-diphosphatase
MPPEPAAPLAVRHAVALGALHGPAELLPVSSSAHVALLPALLGWREADLPGEAGHAFAVALHGGTLLGLLFLVDRPPARLAIPATLPAAVAGLILEGPVARRLGGVRATAAGLLAGSAILLVCDARGGRARHARDATAADALVLGLAQALALAPGVSRLGMAVAAARLRGFDREAAFALGREAGLPVVAGATALKAWRLTRRGLPPGTAKPLAAGAAAALASTLAAAPLRRVTAVWPLAAERCGLAAVALARLGRSSA